MTAKGLILIARENKTKAAVIFITKRHVQLKFLVSGKTAWFPRKTLSERFYPE